MNRLYFFISLIAIFSCSEPKKAPLVRDCLSYNLDKRVFTEDDTLVYNLCIHQLVPEDQTYSFDTLQIIVDSVTKALNAEKVYFRVKSNVVGTNYKDLNITDTTEALAVRKASVNNFEEYTSIMDKERCINLYLMPFKDNDFMGSAGDFIPDVHCAVQAWAFNSSSTPHELMHALGCHHIYEPDITDGYNDEYGDLVCDTPSANNFGKFVNRFCNYALPNRTLEESKILVANLMGNSPSQCRCTITKGQGKRIKKNTQVNKDLYLALYRKY